MSVMQNNAYVHSNPPKAVSGSGFAIRQWVKNGDIDKLEATVLEGQGARLLGLADAAGDTRVKNFLRSVPGMMAKVDMIHDAVIRGSLRETQALLDKKKLATARDAVGRGLPHKAVLYNNKPVIEWLAKKYPETLNLRDNEGRTPLHYSAATRDVEDTYKLLVSLGASPDISDLHGHKPMYYVEHQNELDIEGPANGVAGGTGRSLSRGKRRRISPISKESHSPRKFIISPVGNITNSINNISNNISSYFSQQSSPPSVSRAQIRIWIHEKDIPKLERIVWSGNGEKLLLETSNNGKVRRFLDNVPHLLSLIKSVHTAAINNDVQALKDIKRRTELVEIFKSQDSHGLTALHKAAGLSNRFVLEYLIYEIPDLINISDRNGRVPLHYATKDNNVYGFLVKAGADEDIVDGRGKTPAYYKGHQSELDSRYLRNIPDAPRVSGELLGWDREATAGTGSVHTTTASNSNRRRSSSGEFSLNDTNNEQLVDTTGKYDLDNVDVEITEDELRISNEDDDEDDFEMKEDVEERKNENVIKTNGVGTEEEAVQHEFEPEVVPKKEMKKSGSTSRTMAAPPPPYESGLGQSWPMNETVEMINEEIDNTVTQGASAMKNMTGDMENAADQASSAVRNLKRGLEDSGEQASSAITQVQEDISEAMEATTTKAASAVQRANAEVKNNLEYAEKAAAAIAASAGAEGQEALDCIENTASKAASAAKKIIPTAPRSNKVRVNGEEVEAALEVQMINEPSSVTQQYQDSADLISNSNEQPPSFDKTGDYDGAGYEEEDEIDVALRNRDMETLVDKILQGQGTLLINRTTEHPDVQDFLNNVPAYMTKINAIHAAAAAGSLRDLQTLLDRKRLALARDDMGRGPLHKAILYNHVHIAKHLANTYPQALRLLDKNGRSPLHYAATLPDSGTMYKYLVNWGADPNSKDALNNTPGIYLRNRDLLSHKDLLGTEGRVSRESVRSRSRSGLEQQQQQQGPSTSRMSGVSGSGSGAERWERPKTPDVAALTALDTFYETILMREESFWTRAWRKLTTSTQGNVQVKFMVKKYLTRSLFDELKRLSTASGANLMDVLKFYPQFFIVASDPEVYDVFRQLFIPALADINQTSVGLGGGVGAYIFGDGEIHAREKQARFPAIWSEEGKYLASVLGDALVRGLTQVSQERPTDPVEYLANFLRVYRDADGQPLKQDALQAVASASQSMADATSMVANAAEYNEVNSAQNNTQLEEEEAEEENTSQMHIDAVAIQKSATRMRSESQTQSSPPLSPDTEEEDMLQKLDDEAEAAGGPDSEDKIEEQAPEPDNSSPTPQMRDDHGQSVLHFAASRPGGAQTIYSFLQNPNVNLAWRDENLKTARDVAFQTGRLENLKIIDSFVVGLAVQGDVESLERLLLDGYDNINGVEDMSKVKILDAAKDKPAVVEFLNSIEAFIVKLNSLHHSVRVGSLEMVKKLLRDDSRLASALGPYGRTALHIAVLVEEHAIVQFIAKEFPETLKRGDHLERMPLHYAMGVEKVEKMTRILVRAGGKRVVKDIRGRQPSYYFINREEIALLQEQEDTLKQQ